MKKAKQVELEVELLPHQAAFLDSKAKFTLASGGYGSAKSFSLTISAIDEGLRYPGIEILFCAETLPMIRDTSFKDFMAVCPPNLIKKHTVAPLNVYFHNGSFIKFRSFDQPYKAKSFTVGSIKIEELTTFKKTTFDQLRGRLRQSRTPTELENGLEDYPRTLGAATNPDTKTHWVYKDFFDPDTKVANSVVIESTSYDNQYLPDDYLDDLDEFARTNPTYFKRNVLGEWGRLEGVIYNLPDSQRKIPDNIQFDENIAGLDFGYIHPTSLSVIGIAGDRYFVRDEWHVARVTSKDIIDSVWEYHREYNFYKIYCDGARPEIIQELQDAGLPAVPAIKGPGSVFAGIMYIMGLVNSARFYIDERKAPMHIKEIDGYQWDESDSKKERPLKIRDDSCDSTRYPIYTYALENGLDVSSEDLYAFQKDL